MADPLPSAPKSNWFRNSNALWHESWGTEAKSSNNLHSLIRTFQIGLFLQSFVRNPPGTHFWTYFTPFYFKLWKARSCLPCPLLYPHINTQPRAKQEMWSHTQVIRNSQSPSNHLLRNFWAVIHSGFWGFCALSCSSPRIQNSLFSYRHKHIVELWSRKTQSRSKEKHGVFILASWFSKLNSEMY